MSSATPVPAPGAGRDGFFRSMFDLQAGYLHHRLRREPWWGLDYAFGNFCMFKGICKTTPGVRIDLDEHGWRDLLAAAWRAFEQHRAPEGRAAFTAFLWEQWRARWLAGYPPFEQHQLERNFLGCFCYDYSPEQETLHLHFHNLEAPHSPFADPARRRDDLRAIVREIEIRHYTPRTVHFESWMNHLAPVKELFPRSFAQSLAAGEEFPKGYGWWGQFITKDNQINPKRARMLLDEGRFEYPRLNGHCTWNEFRMKVVQTAEESR